MSINVSAATIYSNREIRSSILLLFAIYVTMFCSRKNVKNRTVRHRSKRCVPNI